MRDADPRSGSAHKLTCVLYLIRSVIDRLTALTQQMKDLYAAFPCVASYLAVKDATQPLQEESVPVPGAMSLTPAITELAEITMNVMNGGFVINYVEISVVITTVPVIQDIN